ncbi:hypothetical protein [Flavivirga algicola]|uniref:Lipoprotein n=1 Tax=Flavivirga algicola TaxID=2729136 RepID=A0ABX1RUV6_9FLAO|nr:hypothetical protein [Flavivirga algicola]NMH86227.1 hypothetical protein [Flavivirga algicola]
MKQIFLKTTFLFLIIIFFTNCNKENIRETPINDIQKIRNEFSIENFNDNTIKDNLSINWDDYYKIENLNNESITYEFNSIFTSSNLFENDNQKLYYEYKLLAIKDDVDIWNIQLVKFLAKDKGMLNTISYFSPNGFSGTLYHYNLKGEALKIIGYENGVKINEFSDETGNLLLKLPAKEEPGDNEDGPTGGGGRNYRWVTVTHYTDWYKIYPNGTQEYTHSVYNKTTYEYVYVGSNNSGSSSYNNYISPQLGNSEVPIIHGNRLLLEEGEMFVETANTPKINDVKKELECFDKSNSAKLTIYVEQAIENSREVTARLGHTFIGIEQNGVIRNLGFYPDNGGAANLFSSQDSEIHDNSGSPYHVSITVDISSNQLSGIINYVENYPVKYDVNKYNCSDFGIKVASLGGLNLPSTLGVGSQFGITLFKGRNPGDLGEDIRELTLPPGATRDLNGGNAPKKSGDCS